MGDLLARPLGGLQMLRQKVSHPIVALLLGSTAVGAHSSSAQETKGVTPKSGFVTLPDGIKLHYLEARSAQGGTNAPAVLFVPGWTMPADIWEYQMSYFSKRHRVVAMEPRPYGLSSQTTEGNYPEAHARDIQAVLDQLVLRPVILVGWSLGVDDVTAWIDQFWQCWRLRSGTGRRTLRLSARF